MHSTYNMGATIRTYLYLGCALLKNGENLFVVSHWKGRK